MVNRKLCVSAWLALFLSMSGCSQCSKSSKSLVELVPADVAGVLVLPNLAQTAKHLSELKDKFAVGMLANFIDQGHNELIRFIGFDPLQLQDLEYTQKLGIAPQKGLAIIPDGTGGVMAIGISNAKLFEEELKKRLQQFAAAEVLQKQKIKGLDITTLGVRVAEQSQVKMIYALVGGYALLGSAATKPERLAQLANLKKEQSLANAHWYSALMQQVPPASDVFVAINGSRATSFKLPDPSLSQHIQDGLVVAISVAATGLSSQFYLALDQTSVNKLNAYSSDVKDGHLEGYLPQDTLFALKLRINPSKVVDELLDLDPTLRSEYQTANNALQGVIGQDLEKDTLRNLTGNLVAGIRLGDLQQVNQMLQHLTRDETAAIGEDPGAIHAFVWLQLKDAAAWRTLLDKLLPAFSQASIQAQKTTTGPLDSVQLIGQEIGIRTYLLQRDKLVGVCVGSGCVQQAAKLVSNQAKALPQALSVASGKLFAEPTLAVSYLNVAKITQILSGLDQSVLGGSMMQMAVGLVKNALQNLGELTSVIRVFSTGVLYSNHLSIK